MTRYEPKHNVDSSLERRLTYLETLMTMPATPENVTAITNQLGALVPVAQQLVTGSDLSPIAAVAAQLVGILTPPVPTVDEQPAE